MAERMAPVDEYGMPYAPYPKNLQIHVPTDRHHPFFKRDAPQLADTAGQMLRMSRVYRMNALDHDEFHAAHMAGAAAFPETEEAKVKLLIPICAGYLSRKAVAMSDPSDPQLTQMDDETYAFMRSPQSMQLDKTKDRDGFYTQKATRSTISMFLTNFVLENGTHDLQQSAVRKFIRRQDVAQLHWSGRVLLSAAIHDATQPFEAQFSEMRERGLLGTEHQTAAALVETWRTPIPYTMLQDRLRGDEPSAA